MGNLYSGEQRNNNLELYLNDVYEKECEFKIEHEEIEFIQTGIETLVQKLVDLILKHGSFDKEISRDIDISSKAEARYNPKTNSLYEGKHIVEVYVPIQNDCSLQRYVTENESHTKIDVKEKCSIIKVGSYYDGTKNDFPDEFDYIVPLLGVTANHDLPRHTRIHVGHVLERISEYVKSLHYPPMSEGNQVTRKLYFDKYIGLQGPANKIQFIYSNGSGEQRPIHVDLVPASKIIDSATEHGFKKKVEQYKIPKTFRKEILSARHCLHVREILAFTEIEQHFMKNILSKKHVKVCRILKYLLNGNGDGEKLEEDITEEHHHTITLRRCIYTSYHIKKIVIYHHESCINTETGDLGPCVLQVLNEMSKYEYSDEIPIFTEARITFSSHVPFCVLPYLKSTIATLQSMQALEEDYNYERDKIKSISGQYLEKETRYHQISKDSNNKGKIKSVLGQYMDNETGQDQTSEEGKERDKMMSVSGQFMDRESRNHQASKDSY